jgi:two-component system, NtrC family, sensor kinase
MNTSAVQADLGQAAAVAMTPAAPRNTASVLKRVGIAGIVIALAGILWFLYAKTQAANFSREDSIIANLRELEALDAEWTVDSLRAKTGINRQYAAGQTPGERVEASSAKLTAAVTALGATESTAALTGVNTVIAQKKVVAGRFIEQNKILKESLRFVTDESAEFLALIRELQSEATQRKVPKQAETLGTLGLRINELLTETLKYNLLSDAAALPRIDASLADLSERAAGYSGDIAPTVRALIEKFQSVKKQKAVEDGILNEIAALPIQARMSALEQAVVSEKQRITTSTNFYRALLIGYSAFLLAAIGWFAWRLAHSYAVIQRNNAELATVNESLEHRVSERTVELADALQHLKDSESALIQSEKMSSLGQMIAGVAHEINTPLAYVRSGLEILDEQLPQSAILSYETLKLLELLSSGTPSEDEIAAQFALVQEQCLAAQQANTDGELAGVIKDGLYGISQISEIVLNLKNFSRLDRAKTSRFDLGEGLDSTLIIAKNLVKTKTIHKEYAKNAQITGSPSQINQVFLNLISNAAQATGDDGVITLRTSVEGAMARVEVEDNGAGIPADVLPKIFDPFFTTKKVGEGTGLGLSIAYKIISEHGGRIEVQSKVGRGTRFIITLPVTVADLSATQPSNLVT